MRLTQGLLESYKKVDSDIIGQGRHGELLAALDELKEGVSLETVR